ncbi:MAG TPA: aa3-type cytochrome c oxidase subunit IV [Alphaproteobacteria bacterium]|nr:aa3-type cytochrome c oxidase subunit IV [Alphaproteobacteria bacterium]
MAMENDLQQHLETWHGFVKMMFFGAAGVVGVLVLLALFFL